MKLVQKQFLKGTREFEIVGEAVTYRLKTPLKEEKLTFDLRMLNPEPVKNGSFLEFQSRVNREALLSLLIDKPNADQFQNFVNEIKQRARQEYNTFAGLKAGSMPEGLAANVYEEPPDFDEPGQSSPKKRAKPVRAADIDLSIQMLEQYLDADDIGPLINALKALKAEPENGSHFAQLVTAFEQLGPNQGAVLTYAPYVGILLSDDPFGY